MPEGSALPSLVEKFLIKKNCCYLVMQMPLDPPCYKYYYFTTKSLLQHPYFKFDYYHSAF